MQKKVCEWYQQNKRDLPWRNDPTPYHVWVSEIMLQQTRVEAVKPYYARFLEVLPTIESLANASEETILKLWEGLGYYSRVRNMQKAARIVMQEYNGELPSNPEELLKLPGIGAYTCGAIASIAYHLPIPALDGNVLRVMARYLKEERVISNREAIADMTSFVKAHIPKENPGEFNQALIEIGATVCGPGHEPECEKCPLSRKCLAHLSGVENEYPKREKKKERRIEEKTVLLLIKDEKIALQKRGSSGLLAGLYEFPMIEGKCGREEVLSFLKKEGVTAILVEELPQAKHVFTHIEWHMNAFEVKVDSWDEKKTQWEYVTIKEARQERAIPSAFAKYTKYLFSKYKD